MTDHMPYFQLDEKAILVCSDFPASYGSTVQIRDFRFVTDIDCMGGVTYTGWVYGIEPSPSPLPAEWAEITLKKIHKPGTQTLRQIMSMYTKVPNV